MLGREEEETGNERGIGSRKEFLSIPSEKQTNKTPIRPVTSSLLQAGAPSWRKAREELLHKKTTGAKADSPKKTSRPAPTTLRAAFSRVATRHFRGGAVSGAGRCPRRLAGLQPPSRALDYIWSKLGASRTGAALPGWVVRSGSAQGRRVRASEPGFGPPPPRPARPAPPSAPSLGSATARFHSNAAP